MTKQLDRDFKEAELFSWDELWDQPSAVQKSLAVNNAVFHHLFLVSWQVNKHSVLFWGDHTMRPAVCKVLDKYRRRGEEGNPPAKFRLIRVEKSLRDLLDLAPVECLIVVVNADEFAHEIPKFCEDWDVLFRFTLMRVLLMSSVDVEIDPDKKLLIKDWLVAAPSLSMAYFDYQIHKVKTFREQYHAAVAEVERAKQLYDQAKEDLKEAIDSDE